MAGAANLNAVRETMDVDVAVDFKSCGVVPSVLTLEHKVLLEISRLLNTGLDMESLSICVRLCEQGINPEALASVIKELRKATESLKTTENMTG